MAGRQAVPVTSVPSLYGGFIATLDFIAEDATNHSQFPSTGQEVLVAWNKGTPTNEVQTVTASGPPTAGTFTLALLLNGVTYLTAAIPYTATAAQLQTALLAAIDPNNVAVSTRYPGGLAVTGATPLPSGTLTVTFGGPLGGMLIAAMTPNNSGLVGGTVAVTEGTPGAGDHQLTVTASKDTFGRAVDLVQNIGAGDVAIIPFFQTVGWIQSDGQIHIGADNALVFFSVAKIAR